MTNPHTASFLIFNVPFPSVGSKSPARRAWLSDRHMRRFGFAANGREVTRMRAGPRPRPFALGPDPCLDHYRIRACRPRAAALADDQDRSKTAQAISGARCRKLRAPV